MKALHNPMIHINGMWYVIEMDNLGVRWAVSDCHRIPYANLFDKVRKIIDENHADKERIKDGENGKK